MQLYLSCQWRLDIYSSANLIKVGWEQLMEVHLSDIELGAEATRCLANASWPKLTCLVLMDCGLDKASMTGLPPGQWTELKELGMSINRDLGGAAISLLAFANWPMLKPVELECIPLCSENFDWWSVKEWTELSRLYLKGTA